MMDEDIRRAMKLFEKNEAHKRWNNKNCRDIKRERTGPKPYKFGNKWGRKK